MYSLTYHSGNQPTLSDLNTPRTSKLGWRYFEANKVGRNKLQIRKNLQKGTVTKMTEKIKLQPCSQATDLLNDRTLPRLSEISEKNWST